LLFAKLPQHKQESQALSSVVLPEPVGAAIRVNFRRVPASSCVISRDHATRPGRGGGIDSFVVRDCLKS